MMKTLYTLEESRMSDPTSQEREERVPEHESTEEIDTVSKVLEIVKKTQEVTEESRLNCRVQDDVVYTELP